MPKKFAVNSKAAAGRERKAAQDAEKKAKQQAALEQKEEERWSQGAKKAGKKESEAEKRAELEALKEQEEKELSKMKRAPAAKQTRLEEDLGKHVGEAVPVFSADNLDDALEALEIVDDKATRPGGSGAPDRHVERRLKAAYAAYEERELPLLKQENPGLRLSQLKQLLWKQWQKSPENPLNQASLAYNATRDQEAALLQTRRDEIEARLKE
ncbi:hypothetical protein SYNPS1DRAFT_20530 [Syncephalis pseudoplumigaleata]|uniref:Coiled-coil domain-containing protein 124 n=1 Tax=Syncephalis pseudoplumigaleata TaxID=1712513 RepID=A0A4P9Z8P7_9FUNG|nr:hypothetical protein SYNPS1DRAFT_20530 [Syncephalis pseudoplumigaleata]|eukprot:RKP28120.1 hypothetical protein SYNPS1DRAFT_20530 [Syncephalis pseudoplumigaleata]